MTTLATSTSEAPEFCFNKAYRASEGQIIDQRAPVYRGLFEKCGVTRLSLETGNGEMSQALADVKWPVKHIGGKHFVNFDLLWFCIELPAYQFLLICFWSLHQRG